MSDDVTRWWQASTTGGRKHMVGVRVTETEEVRLEELRRMLRLRSSSEVVRFALQVVECACAGRRLSAESADQVVASVEECLRTGD